MTTKASLGDQVATELLGYQPLKGKKGPKLWHKSSGEYRLLLTAAEVDLYTTSIAHAIKLMSLIPGCVLTIQEISGVYAILLEIDKNSAVSTEDEALPAAICKAFLIAKG